MVSRTVNTETIPQSNSDALTEAWVKLKANEVLQHGILDAKKNYIVYGEFSVGRRGTVYRNNHPIGLIKDWSEVKKKYGMA